jgi:hypothetical protein
MKGSIGVGSLAVVALGLIAAPARAQTTVQGSVIVQSGPVGSHPVVRQRTRVIVPERHVIIVQRVHVPRGWWKKHSYRAVTVYYDGDLYYLRRLARPNLRAVIVYERGGRYFIGDDRWKREHRNYDHHDDRYRDHD